MSMMKSLSRGGVVCIVVVYDNANNSVLLLRHNDIVTRQQQIWDAKYKKYLSFVVFLRFTLQCCVPFRLCEDLGISNIEKITKGETRKSHDNIRTKATETGDLMQDINCTM